MSPYQNYYSNQMNPYMNNYQGYNPMINAQQRMAQMEQQLMPQNQIAGNPQPMNIMGKIVDSVDVVKATDVPMDGNMYYFPKADGTEIFGKQWLANGQTRILTFKPVLETDANNSTTNTEKLKFDLSDEATDTFMKRFDSIEKRLDDFIGKNTAKTPAKAKKEDEA